MAEKLGKTVEEIGRMSSWEWAGWQAYVKLKNEIEERGRLQAEAGRGARGRTAKMRRR